MARLSDDYATSVVEAARIHAIRQAYRRHGAESSSICKSGLPGVTRQRVLENNGEMGGSDVSNSVNAQTGVVPPEVAVRTKNSSETIVQCFEGSWLPPPIRRPLRDARNLSQILCLNGGEEKYRHQPVEWCLLDAGYAGIPVLLLKRLWDPDTRPARGPLRWLSTIADETVKEALRDYKEQILLKGSTQIESNGMVDLVIAAPVIWRRDVEQEIPSEPSEVSSVAEMRPMQKERRTVPSWRYPNGLVFDKPSSHQRNWLGQGKIADRKACLLNFNDGDRDAFKSWQ
ncbi:hypothetical protein FOZ60_016514, partial [Perkinsus olseni]